MAKADWRFSHRISRQFEQPSSAQMVQRPRDAVSREPDHPLYHSTMAILLAGQVMHRLLRGRFGQRQIMDNLMCAGPRCVASVMATNICTGIIFAIQTAREMSHFGAVSSIGSAFCGWLLRRASAATDRRRAGLSGGECICRRDCLDEADPAD